MLEKTHHNNNIRILSLVKYKKWNGYAFYLRSHTKILILILFSPLGTISLCMIRNFDYCFVIPKQ